ncbi:hypothetical protein HF847_04890 [Clostridium cochlearium]|uniref:phage antirepressor N-terminal domain-containing protein n=1 Tax=Clostridium cochlearium TaxID=1494 RepID=UPI001459F5ED|nr:phage antirepressor N-terminal domain-containing protein [Clostridium cochlearium]NME95329.1 hypothetical protein [Clostridium cochlearium]
MSSLLVKEVNFKDINMTACKTVEGNVFVGIRSVCDSLGIAYNGQMERINRDDILPEGVRKIRIPTSGGEQEINMLDIEYLPFFLTGIKSSMCREEVRPKLLEFKLKAKDVLAEAFLNKPTCMEDIWIAQIQEMKNMRLQLQQTKQKVIEADNKANEAKEEIQVIRDVITINPKAEWRKETNRVLNAIGRKIGDYKLPKDEAYNALKEIGHCRPTVLVNNLKKRARANGMAPSKVEKLNILDVLENEPRLKEIYINIVGKMAIKNNIS